MNPNSAVGRCLSDLKDDGGNALSKDIADLDSVVRTFQTYYEANWLLQDLDHQIQYLRDILTILKDMHSHKVPGVSY